MQFVYVCLKQIAGICNSQGQLGHSRQPEPWEIYDVKQRLLISVTISFWTRRDKNQQFLICHTVKVNIGYISLSLRSLWIQLLL